MRSRCRFRLAVRLGDKFHRLIDPILIENFDFFVADGRSKSGDDHAPLIHVRELEPVLLFLRVGLVTQDNPLKKGHASVLEHAQHLQTLIDFEADNTAAIVGAQPVDVTAGLVIVTAERRAHAGHHLGRHRFSKRRVVILLPPDLYRCPVGVGADSLTFPGGWVTTNDVCHALARVLPNLDFPGPVMRSAPPDNAIILPDQIPGVVWNPLGAGFHLGKHGQVKARRSRGQPARNRVGRVVVGEYPRVVVALGGDCFPAPGELLVGEPVFFPLFSLDVGQRAVDFFTLDRGDGSLSRVVGEFPPCRENFDPLLLGAESFRVSRQEVLQSHRLVKRAVEPPCRPFGGAFGDAGGVIT